MAIKLKNDEFNGLRGNNAIKDAYQTVFTNKAEYEEMVEEIVKCKNDIVYFAETYFTIIAATGKCIIKLYPKQKELLRNIAENQNTIVLAARQAGKSTVYTIFALWYAMFNREKGVLICANKFATAKELMERIQLAYELLPSWLKVGCKEYNKGRVVFENDSKIEIAATSGTSARGKSGEVLIIDEAAFVPNNIMSDFIQSVLPIVSSRPDSKIIVVSTPNGTGNWYAETYHKALYNLNEEEGWSAFRIDWWDVPGRDEEWKRKELAKMNGDVRKFSQEYGNSFLGSAMTLINAKAITHYKELSEGWTDGEKHKIKDWEARVWHKPIKGRTYIQGIDIAEGVGGDFSTIIVIDATDTSKLKVCCTFADNTISPSDFAYVSAKISRQYNNAMISGERNGIGKSTMDILWNVFEMDNILCWKNAKEPQTVPGIFSHNTIKVDGCMWTKFLLEGFDLFDMELNDKNILYELEYFEKKNNTTRTVYQAVEGKHDDYIMALVWCLYMIEPTICDYNFIVESTIMTRAGIPVPRVIRTDSIVDDDFFTEETYGERDDDYDLDAIYDNLTGKKTVKKEETEIAFDLDDDSDIIVPGGLYEEEPESSIWHNIE